MKAKLTAILILAASATSAQVPDVGQGLYSQHCASCHGAAADGAGPMAPFLTVPSPRLDDIAARNEGKFPMLDVIHVIDGRTGLRGHGGEMPVFGALFTADAGRLETYGSVIETRGRIMSIALFLETIQN